MTKTVALRRIARMHYGDALPEGKRRKGKVAVFGSAGPVGCHDVANTGSPVIIIGRKGSYGKVSYSEDPVFAIDTAYYIDPSSTSCDLQWLKYVLEAAKLDQTSQDVGVPGLSRETAYAARVPLTSLDMQRDLVTFLDGELATLRNLISQKRKLRELFREKRARLALAAVGGELIDNSEERTTTSSWLTSIPSHWRMVKLSLVAQLGTGHTPSRSNTDYWDTERVIPWLTTGDIERFRDDRCDVLTNTAESISQLGLENSAAVLHPAGTVALSRTASVGFSIIMGRDMATSQDFVTWTCSDRLDPHFLLLCLRAMRTDLQKRLAVGSTHKTIYMPDLQGLRIPLPPLDEQRRAVELAGEMMEQIDLISDLIDRQVPLLQERQDALISAAVAGELDPSSYRTPAVAG
jgi:type I restriction enzyme, S subunit